MVKKLASVSSLEERSETTSSASNGGIAVASWKKGHNTVSTLQKVSRA